ncbi:MAG: SAM-dependent methyltransferase [Micrococcales bacterium]|nr:MAG: SAM-dependent methyltransferase [Micrococcales bacterium]
MSRDPQEIVDRAEEYYDSCEADEFYFNIWGGEDIHIGLYETPTDDIATASQRTVHKLADRLSLHPGRRVLDLGAGYGGAARYLARTFGAHVTALNLSRTQNRRNQQLCADQQLSGLVQVVDGNFEELPFEADGFDAVWSQDSLLHSARRERVLQEAHRVLRPGGELLFTDPMQAERVPAGALQPVYDRINLDSLGSIGDYRAMASRIGFQENGIEVLTDHLRWHYSRVADELHHRYDEMCRRASKDYVDRMLEGLRHWVEATAAGHLTWGILHFRKHPAGA